MSSDTDLVLYRREGRVARLTLNRPARLNAIALRTPPALEAAVKRANEDDEVHVIVLDGAGRAFCSGYDLKDLAEAPGGDPTSRGTLWDPMDDYRLVMGFTRNFMSLHHSDKPTICKVRGHAVGGGSDIALCCDLVVMAEEARIGYPPARVWGCPTTAMWVYRLGPEKAKRMLLTGDTVSGREAAAMGLVLEAVPEEELDRHVDALAARMAGVPRAQLMMHKLMINQALEGMGLSQTQMIATLFDGIARHGPAGVAWKQRVEEVGFRQAVRERDGGDPIPERPDPPRDA